MHGIERNIGNPQGWGEGEERGERVAMHGRERNRESPGRGEGRGEERKSSNAWQREK